MRIEACGVGKKREGHVLLGDVSLSLPSGGISVVIGPNGAGKTTLLRILALLDRPSSGEVLYDGLSAARLAATRRTTLRRRLGFVFQHPLLLNGSTADNLRYALKVRRIPPAEDRIAAALEGLGLAPKADLDVRVLSGGEKQRLQLARAMVLEPEVLFADEPTANLDPISARFIEDRLGDMAGAGRTVVLTTHNLLQARLLGARLFFLQEGRLVQEGTAVQVLENPATIDVAHFSPITNVLPGLLIRTPDEAVLAVGRTRIRVVSSLAEGPVTAVLRPEDILVSREPIRSSARNRIAGKVTAVRDLGMFAVLRVEGEDLGLNVMITRQSLAELGIRAGEIVDLTFKASAVLLFAPGAGESAPRA
jgi:molybdopterin-binding protein